MKTSTMKKLLALAVCAIASAAPMRAGADDIDIFTGASAGTAGNPRVLIVLDNTSNWSRQSQKWPGGIQQGQSEVNAVKSVVLGDGSAGNPGLTDKINLGLMEFVTNGNANDNGGFIRYNIRPMTGGLPAVTNYKADLATKLTTIYNNVTSPSEKRNSNVPYGNLMNDVYNYFAGANAYSALSPPNPDTDSTAYTTAYSKFKAPLTADGVCGSNFMIFIGNPNASGPKADSAANTAALAALGGNTTQLGFSGVTTSSVVAETSTTILGNTTACYPSLAAAQSAYGYALNEADNACQLYADIGTAGAATTDKNNSSCTKYSNLVGEVTHATATDFLAQCRGLTDGCVLSTPIDNPTMTVLATGVTGYLTAAPAATAADAGVKAGLSCPVGATGCTYGVAVNSTAAAKAAVTGITSTNCYWDGTGGSAPGGYAAWTSATNDFGGVACPAGYTCSYTKTGTTDPGNYCTTSHTKYAVLTQSFTPQNTYLVTQTATVPGGTCPTGQNQYKVVGATMVYSNVFTTTVVPDSGPRNADEWARFMHDKGIPVAAPTAADPAYVAHPSVITYTIDVYNKQPNAEQTQLLMSMAKAGGGKYYVAKSESDIVNALKQIMVEIQAVNSAFASTSLPVNATNRSQNDNEVFIGMFRPDPTANPRWFGNLKRYQLIYDGSNVVLGDANLLPAINPLTGFLTPCATSYWTTDSGSYWSGMSLNPDPAGSCNTTAYDKYSDAPDGPQVEKGAVAEVLRKAGPPATSRTMYTRTANGNALVPFATNAGSLSASLVSFIQGADTQADKSADPTQPRPSIHGDVIHSRPLPINYGTGTGVEIFYGANDGTFRSVNADSGAENWSFVAPEFFPRLARLQANTEKVSNPNSAVGSPKDYFFDGSTGVYQSAGTPMKVWLYPTMRRGGRMIYGLDASSPTEPKFKWAVGCPNLTDDVGCTTDAAMPDAFKPMGQSWSTPTVVFIKGNTDPKKPVILVGGGYDKCEDDNTATPSCTSNLAGASTTKGGVIYALDADTGAIIRRFNTDRAVAADIAVVDINNDGYVDYAYAVDVGGRIYRLNFIDTPTNRTPLVPSNWTVNNVAYTAEATRRRKFLFAPALVPLQNKVYLAIGSGDREHPLITQYPYEGVKYNRLYVYRDDPTSAPNTNLDTDANMVDYTSSTTCSATSVFPSSTKIGWYMDLAKGEQVVTSALIAGGMVTFSTNQPIDSGSSCSNSLGTARGYWVNLFNASGAIGVAGTCGGTRSSTFVGGGLPPSPVMATSVPVVIPGTTTTAQGSKATTVVVGAAQRDAGTDGGDSGTLHGASKSDKEAQALTIKIPKERTRTYTYTTGD
ncbi:MAG: PilC/PilY family type IV pilus protein [Pseudomonadota bacterium]